MEFSLGDTLPVSQTDALGGAGSIVPQLQSLAVNGLSRAIDGFLSQKFPLTSFNEPLSAEGAGAYEPGGYLVPRGAPGFRGGYGNAPIVNGGAAQSLFSNPIVYGGAALLAVLMIVVLVRR